jgi:Uma2 family endonuclease
MRTKKRTGTRSRRWTKKEYYRLGKLRFFDGQRVELLEGWLIIQSPITPLNAYIVRVALKALHPLLPDGHLLRCKLPLDLGKNTEPEPDFALVQDSSRQQMIAHPTSAVLIIEVADSSLDYDRKRKGSLYARAGVPDYWIVNLVDNRVEVYRDPVPDAAERYGHRYCSRFDLVPPASIAPLAFPGIVIAVTSLLP